MRISMIPFALSFGLLVAVPALASDAQKEDVAEVTLPPIESMAPGTPIEAPAAPGDGEDEVPEDGAGEDEEMGEG